MADTNFGTNRRGRTGTGAGTINFMRKLNRVWMGLVVACAIAGAAPAQDQGGTGALEFTAYVSPTAAKPEPVLDLTMPGLDKLLTPDDILGVPELLLAYQRSNSGGVTSGIPKPKYRDAEKTERPERYEKEHQEYLTALKK